jgi:hypothetical protein
VFRNKYSVTTMAENPGNETLHFLVGDAEQQIGQPDQLGLLGDQEADVQADLVAKTVGEELMGLVPVISCILITLRDDPRQNTDL